jgi:hypothetical protein
MFIGISPWMLASAAHHFHFLPLPYLNAILEPPILPSSLDALISLHRPIAYTRQLGIPVSLLISVSVRFSPLRSSDIHPSWISSAQVQTGHRVVDVMPDVLGRDGVPSTRPRTKRVLVVSILV